MTFVRILFKRTKIYFAG